ncbi:MAG: TIR domain-containing protein [Chloroflexota bacterium]
MDPLKILILYGGKAATQPRNELLDWLNSSQTHTEIGRKIDARKVAEMTAHMDRSIDQRVEDMMDWADKAIFLLTTDERSEYGAPNVLEEFGRWIGQKGRRTMMALRQDGVKVHSNASGLVYVAFKDDVVNECRGRLVAFIHDPLPATPEASAAQEPRNSGQSINISGGVSTGGDLTMGNKNTTTRADRDVYQGERQEIHHHYYGTSHPQQETAQNQQKDPAGNTSKPAGDSKTITMIQLKDFLSAKFNVDELTELCFGLGIDSENFSSSKSLFAMQFVQYLQRRDQFEELINLLAETRGSQLEKAFGSTAITVK